MKAFHAKYMVFDDISAIAILHWKIYKIFLEMCFKINCVKRNRKKQLKFMKFGTEHKVHKKRENRVEELR